MKRKRPTLGWSNISGPLASFEIHSVYDIVDVIRKRPEMFLGSRTLTGLHHFINGFRLAADSVGIQIQDGEPPFRSFHQWIETRLDGGPSDGWLQTLLEAMRDEESAYERFLLEVDEFRRLGG
ncbi:hypothetical protein BH11MYX3_BH11MYX3_16550 [soil metagenome]